MIRLPLKKIITYLLTVVLLAGVVPLVSPAAAARSTSAEESLAYDLKTLELFGGTGTNADGTVNFDLNRQGSRVEALVMLIRLLGEEAEAKAFKDTCIFTDVPAWAQCHVSYAYAKGYTNGSVYDEERGIYLFGTGTVTAEMFCTFLLRALGYSDLNGVDFTWDKPFDLARRAGLLTTKVNTASFWRADMVTLSYNALFSKLKGSDKPLADKLLAAGVFDETQYKIATCDVGYTVLPAGQVPSALCGRKLTDSQIQALVGKDAETLQATLSTVEDIAAWFDASDFFYMDGAWWSNSPNSYYKRYEAAPSHLYSQQNLTYTGRADYLGIDNVSYVAAWLLQDDFTETGVLAALFKGNTPDYTAAYLKLGSTYYILDFATLIPDTMGRVRHKMLASIKTESLYALSSVVRDTGNARLFALMGITSRLDEPLHFAKFGNNAEFVQPDKVQVLYSGSGNITLENYVIASGTQSRVFNLQSYRIPSGLGGSTLTFDEAKALAGKDAETIAAAVKTVPDMLIFMSATSFKMSNGDIQVPDGSVTWHFNNSAITSLTNGYANCGATANTVRYLLDGDYDEVGYICHTYINGGGGGHVYNYIKAGGKYYIVDMTAYTGSNYSTGATAILELDSLPDYAECFGQMKNYGDYLPVIYAYQAERELPMAWNNSDTYTTWFPEGTALTVLCEDTANGYSIGYRPLTSGVSAEIEAARADETTRANDITDFKGLSAYALPSGLGGATLTNTQISKLVSSGAELDTVAGAVKTVGDAMMYLYAAGFISGDGDILTSGSAGQEWRCNLLASAAFAQKETNCGATANLVRYLLDGDYDEVGYVCHTYAYGDGGGHVYNYVRSGGEYYVVDLNAYLVCDFAPNSYVLSVGDSLNNYANSWSRLYRGSSIKVIYAYSLPQELPLSWSIFDDVYVTYLPEDNRNDVRIILESGEYSVGFAALSPALWDFINTKR